MASDGSYDIEFTHGHGGGTVSARHTSPFLPKTSMLAHDASGNSYSYNLPKVDTSKSKQNIHIHAYVTPCEGTHICVPQRAVMVHAETTDDHDTMGAPYTVTVSGTCLLVGPRKGEHVRIVPAFSVQSIIAAHGVDDEHARLFREASKDAIIALNKTPKDSTNEERTIVAHTAFTKSYAEYAKDASPLEKAVENNVACYVSRLLANGGDITSTCGSDSKEWRALLQKTSALTLRTPVINVVRIHVKPSTGHEEEEKAEDEEGVEDSSSEEEEEEEEETSSSEEGSDEENEKATDEDD